MQGTGQHKAPTNNKDVISNSSLECAKAFITIYSSSRDQLCTINYDVTYYVPFMVVSEQNSLPMQVI